jgi:hypothetical protein
MNTNLLTICNVLTQKPGAVPSAPNTNTTPNTTKNAQNSTDKTTATDERPYNNTVETKNMHSSKENQTFNDALDKKINSQIHHGDRKRKEQDLDQVKPETIFPTMSHIACLVAQPEKGESTGQLQLSDKTVLPESLNELLAVKAMVVASAPETTADDKGLAAIGHDNNEAAIAVNNLTIAAQTNTGNASVPLSQNNQQPVQELTQSLINSTKTSAGIELPIVINNHIITSGISETQLPSIPPVSAQMEMPMPETLLGDSKTSSGISETSLPPVPSAFAQVEMPMPETLLGDSKTSSGISETPLPPVPSAFAQVEMPMPETLSGDSKTSSGISETPLPPVPSAFARLEIPTPKTLPGKSKTSSDIEQPAVTKNIVSDQPVDPKKNDISFLNSVLSGLIKKSSPSQTQQNLSIARQDRPENTVQASMPNQKNDIQTEANSVQSSTHKMNVSAEQINAIGVEKWQNISVNKDYYANSKSDNKISMDAIIPSAVTEQPLLSTAPSKIAGITNSDLGLGRQIQESVSSFYRPGTQQIVIRLNPPDLGQVTIKFIEHRDGISGTLHVDKLQTKDQIQQALPGIIQNLQNSDIPIKKLDVVLTNQQQYTASGEQSGGHNSASEQQNPHGPNPLENPVSYNEWLANSNNIRDFTDPRIQLSDDSINMLI